MGRRTKGQTCQPKAESNKSKPSPSTLNALPLPHSLAPGPAKPSKAGTTPTAQAKGHPLLVAIETRVFLYEKKTQSNKTDPSGDSFMAARHANFFVSPSKFSIPRSQCSAEGPWPMSTFLFFQAESENGEPQGPASPSPFTHSLPWVDENVPKCKSIR